MAKLFANLDRLKDSPTPSIMSMAQPISYEAQATTVNPNKPNIISLSDRLKQSNLGTTKHLPEFFLSDTYTGFIKIKKFGTYEHTSNIEIKQPTKSVTQGETTVKPIATNPTQGGTDPIFSIASVLTRQGVVQLNNRLDSVITVKQPVAGLNQGTVVVNQVLNTPNQGSITINQSNPIINQGVGTNPIQPIQDVSSLQGILVTGGGRSTTGTEKSAVVIPNPSGVGINIINPEVKLSTPRGDNGYLTLDTVVDTKGIKINTNEALASRESDKVNAIPTLQVLAYESDRLLAQASPKIKHGSTLEVTKVDKYNGILQFNPTIAPIRSYTTDFINGLPAEPLINVLGKGVDSNNILDSYITTPAKGYPVQKNNLSADSAWKVWTYNSDKQSQSTDVNSAADLSKIIAANANKQTSYSNNESTITITRIGKPDPVVFTAFLTALSDNTTPTFNEYTYVGKQDTFRTYKGTTRQISLGFKAVALGNDATNNAGLAQSFNHSANYVRILAQKVNKLIQLAGMGEVGSQAYTQGPILKLKVAGLYNDLIVVASSIKVDVPIEDATWDDNGSTNLSRNQGPKHTVDKLLPNYYNISMDFNVLSTQEKTLFDIDKTYIGY